MSEDTLTTDITIENYAIVVRERTVKDFDEKNKAQLDVALAELQKLLMLKLMVLSKGCDFGKVARYDAFALTKSALDVLVSALHMARQRANAEAISLLRIALECGGTALHIFHNPDAYEKYRKGKGTYHSTTAISFAKKFIPVLGEIWGAYSQAAVHINAVGFGPKYTTDSEGHFNISVLFEYGNRKNQPVQDHLMLTSVSLVAALILKMTEIVVCEKSPTREGLLQVAGTKTILISNTDAAILKYEDELRSYPSKQSPSPVEKSRSES